MKLRLLFVNAALFALCLTASPSQALVAPRAAVVRVENLTINDAPPPQQYLTHLQTAIDSQIPAIRECYRTRLTDRPTLGGTLRLRLWVSARQVIRATPENTLGDPALEECTRSQIRRFTLPAQVPSGGVTVKFAVIFIPPPVEIPAPAAQDRDESAGRAVIAMRATVGFARPSAALSRRLDAAVFQNCANIHVHSTGGSVILSVRTDRRGRLTASATRRSTASAELRACTIAAAQASAGTGTAERNTVTILYSR